MAASTLKPGAFPAYIGFAAGYAGPYYANATGISIWDGESSVTNYSTSNGLVNDDVRSISVKSENEVYISTSNGLSIFNGSTFTNYYYGQGPGDGFKGFDSSAIAADGKVYFGGAYNQGFCRWDGATFQQYTTANGLLSNYVNGIYALDDGSIWFFHAAGYGTCGMSKFDGVSTFTTYTFSGYMERCAIGSNGKFYFINSSSVLEWTEGPNQPTYIYSLPQSNYNGSFESANGKIYAAVYDRKFSVYSLTTSTQSTPTVPSSSTTYEFSRGIAFLTTGDVLQCVTGGGIYQIVNDQYFNLPIITGAGGLTGMFPYCIALAAPTYVTNVKTSGTKVTADVTIDPRTKTVVLPSGEAIPTGSVLRDTVTNNKYLKIAGSTKTYDLIPANPDPAWAWQTGNAAWTTLQNT